MQKLNSGELEKINGGFSVWAGLAIAAIIIFIAGVLEGITNPEECNNG